MAALSTKNKVLLVDGYIREHEEILKLSNIIPRSINSIIFEFQLLIETWNRKWSNSNIEIIDDDNTAEMSVGKHQTVHGDHVVKCGEKFVWNLEIIKGENCSLFIGITPNDEEILIENKTSFKWYRKGGYLWKNSGRFGFDRTSRHYGKMNKFKQKGDKLKIRFDWKENSLHYIANGEDFGNALDIQDCKELTSDDKAEFRFALCYRRGKDVAIKIGSDTY